MEIGTRIKMKREAMGMTRAQLAAQIGCSAERISQFERGELPKHMGGGVMANLKRALKVRARGAAKPAKRAKAPASRPEAVKASRETMPDLEPLMGAINRLSASMDRLASAMGHAGIYTTEWGGAMGTVAQGKTA